MNHLCTCTMGTAVVVRVIFRVLNSTLLHLQPLSILLVLDFVTDTATLGLQV